MRPKVLVGFIIAAALFLTGCTSLPTSGEAQVFEFETPRHQAIRQYGAAPREGADPPRLVEDFLRTASAGVYDDYATARMYLTPEASLSWVPSERVLIFSTEQSPDVHLLEEDDEDEGAVGVAVTVSTIGTLDESRVLEESPKEGQATLNFGLEKNSEGEWRISQLEAGVVLSESAFDTSFQPIDLLFPSQDGLALIPDPRWYGRTPKQTTQMVQDLIDGPAADVAQAVGTEMRSGWTLPQRGVEVVDGAAKVDLLDPENVSADERFLMTWSLFKTLKQSPGVSHVEVEINSVPQQTSSLPAGPDYIADQVVGVVDDSIVAGSVGDWRVALPPTVATSGPSHPAMGPTLPGPIAWLQGDQTAFILRERKSELAELKLESPSPMSADRFGNVWLIAGPKDARTLYRIGIENTPEPVALPPELGGAPRLVKVAPDGARIGIQVETSAESTLWVGAVSRLGDEDQFTVEDLQLEDRADPDIVDFAWNDSTRLEVLVGDPAEGDMSVQRLPIGGWASTISAPAEAVRITASRTGSTVLVQREDGLIFQLSGASWFEAGDQPNYVSFPG